VRPASRMPLERAVFSTLTNARSCWNSVKRIDDDFDLEEALVDAEISSEGRMQEIRTAIYKTISSSVALDR
jgi:hypothetical protein